jgi:hypothetical protein
LWQNCAGCHRPGEVGPFSLLDYEDAAKRADFLAQITADRRMPPWKAAPDFGKFHDERRLSDEQIALIERWAAAGAPRGNDADLPPEPKFTDGWQLGEPDLVLTMPEEVSIPADGRDVYRCIVIPIPVDENRTVSAVEFRPGNRRVVHHAIMYLDASGAARKRDEQDPGPGYQSFGGPGILPTGGLGGWAPGSMPRHLPEGVGKFLRKGSDLVLQLHYHPSGKPETDRSSVGIYFTKKPATTITGGLLVMNHKLYIEPGDKDYHITAKSEPLPVDVNVLAVSPHMHLLGREMKAVAKLPDGKTEPLVWIKDWDFNWQGHYGYAKPVRLPKGSTIELEAVYDNSADNPRNPNSPPKLVRWGEQTPDEMCLMGVVLTTDSVADLRAITMMGAARLGGALVGGVQLRDIAGGEQAIKDGKIPDELQERVNLITEEILDRGFPIPAAVRETLRPLDKNDDVRISREEFDAAPALARDKIRDSIREKVRAALAPNGG